MFQLQFSMQTTDYAARSRMIPAKTWSFEQISAYAKRFVEPGDRKVVLNFALADGIRVEAEEVARRFDPGSCLVKLTPLNPTSASQRAGLRSTFCQSFPQEGERMAEAFRAQGFDCIVSMGLAVETERGSSCGQLAIVSARS